MIFHIGGILLESYHAHYGIVYNISEITRTIIIVIYTIFSLPHQSSTKTTSKIKTFYSQSIAQRNDGGKVVLSTAA